MIGFYYPIQGCQNLYNNGLKGFLSMASHWLYVDSTHFWIWPTYLAEQNSKMCRICMSQRDAIERKPFNWILNFALSWTKVKTDQIWFFYNHSKVTLIFVSTGASKRVTWTNIVNQFMRKRNHKNVILTFVTTADPKSMTWEDISNQLMRRTNLSNLTLAAPKEEIWSLT